MVVEAGEGCGTALRPLLPVGVTTLKAATASGAAYVLSALSRKVELAGVV